MLYKSYSKQCLLGQSVLLLCSYKRSFQNGWWWEGGGGGYSVRMSFDRRRLILIDVRSHCLRQSTCNRKCAVFCISFRNRVPLLDFDDVVDYTLCSEFPFFSPRPPLQASAFFSRKQTTFNESYERNGNKRQPLTDGLRRNCMAETSAHWISRTKALSCRVSDESEKLCLRLLLEFSIFALLLAAWSGTFENCCRFKFCAAPLLASLWPSANNYNNRIFLIHGVRSSYFGP